jgi:ABC-2 type transport system permease protein
LLSVFAQMIRRRRLSLFWWCTGMIVLDALYIVAFPPLRNNAALDRTFSNLSPGVQALLGLAHGTAITSPVGYLNSQYYANTLPIVLLVLAVGLAAWAVAGDEGAGTLELLLANPVSRIRVALARALGLVLMLLGVAFVGGGALAAMAPLVALDKGLPLSRIVVAAIASALLALVFAAIAYALGAASGRRNIAIAVAAVVVVFGYVLEGVAQQVGFLHPVRLVNPWHWMLSTDPLGRGASWQAFLLPLAVSAALFAFGALAFARRDLR